MGYGGLYGSYPSYLDESAPGMAAEARGSVERAVELLSAFSQEGMPLLGVGLRDIPLWRWRGSMLHRVVGRDPMAVALYVARQDLTQMKPDDA